MSKSPFYRTGVSKSPLHMAAQDTKSKKVDAVDQGKKDKKNEVDTAMNKVTNKD